MGGGEERAGESERPGLVCALDAGVREEGISLGRAGNLTPPPLSLQNGYINFDKRRKVRRLPGPDASYP